MSKRALALLAAVISASGAALAADAGGKTAIPNFATDSGTGWRIDRTVGVDDLLAAPGGGPGPITNIKAYPYVPNGGGRQPTYRVADLSNPILQEWRDRPRDRLVALHAHWARKDALCRR